MGTSSSKPPRFIKTYKFLTFSDLCKLRNSRTNDPQNKDIATAMQKIPTCLNFYCFQAAAIEAGVGLSSIDKSTLPSSSSASATNLYDTECTLHHTYRSVLNGYNDYDWLREKIHH